ncbi:DUF1848 family protein [Thermorudis peleae]|uniref:DUF1848 family protein n=1 Tax=Thermorudis peleae TaxID=1382356 RepID=UPI001E38A7EE|nr:DUF1848 family protein [Thermorudis peleae]
MGRCAQPCPDPLTHQDVAGGSPTSAADRTPVTSCPPRSTRRRARTALQARRPACRALTHVSLHPDDVLAIVWWSKNYAVYLRVADRLACYQRQHFHFTITPRRDDLRWIEPEVPPLDAVLAQARALVARFGPQALTWRYDPLLFWTEDGQPRSSWDPAFFEQGCRTLGSLGVRRCVTSIIDPYFKVVRRWQRCFPERPLRQPDPEEVAAIGTAMVEIASAWGIQMEACAEPALAAVPGFVAAACIDATVLAPECYAAPAQLALPLLPSIVHEPAASPAAATGDTAPSTHRRASPRQPSPLRRERRRNGCLQRRPTGSSRRVRPVAATATPTSATTSGKNAATAVCIVTPIRTIAALPLRKH